MHSVISHRHTGGPGVYVLGINAYHAGASACLILDGQLVAAAEEERFNRIKYCAGFPAQAVAWCLAEAGISAYQLDHIAISRDPSAHLPRKILQTLRHRPGLDLLRDRLHNSVTVRNPKRVFVDALHLDSDQLRAQFHNVEHHRAHMASAFFVSPLEEAAVLSVDGMGDFCSTMWGIGRGNRLEVAGSVHFPHSLGIFYTAVSQWLGFAKYGDEGKVMGLAPYGQPRHVDDLRNIIRIQRDGTFELVLDWFVHHVGGASMTWDAGTPELGPLYSRKFVDHFGAPHDPRRAALEPRSAQHEAGGAVHPDACGYPAYYLDMAASLQAVLEEAELALVNMVQRTTAQRALCLAGGVALNSVFNGKIRPCTAFEEVFVQPAAGDAGTSLGAAYYVYHHVLGYPRSYVMHQSATGPGFSDLHIMSALDAHALTYRRLDEAALCRSTAELIDAGKVVGWFQGRMEWGPRALGHRSILADPRRSDTKDILNARIKHRERFRPFAPSVLAEATGTYFDQEYPDPFMTKVYGVRPARQPEIPAVTHVDGTGRLQTVDPQVDPLYGGLIQAFEQLTGTPVVLNTSFNENEPIVCRPDEAIECFLRTRMDALAIGSFLITKA